MKNKNQLSPEIIYEMVAEVGFKRHFHLGGLAATRKLIELCGIDETKYVLDVGCATGKTACYLAKRYGCRVIGVDILEKMIDRSNERASLEGIEDRVSFRVGDVQSLPFEDGIFDVVISEFVAGLLGDKRKGVSEYLRVTKYGGCVGLNEATWVRTPPPVVLVEYLSEVFGFRGEILAAEGWEELLKDVGVTGTVASVHNVKALSRTREDLGDVLRVWPRILSLYVRNSTFRRFIRETVLVPKNLLDYLGYGIYVSRKLNVSDS